MEQEAYMAAFTGSYGLVIMAMDFGCLISVVYDHLLYSRFRRPRLSVHRISKFYRVFS
jgi:hypothetical protein